MKITHFRILLTITIFVLIISSACIKSENLELLKQSQKDYSENESITQERIDEKVKSTSKFTQIEQTTITVVYDNEPWDKRLDNAWGFACFVDSHDKKILFDTGGDGEILLKNMEILGIKPSEINAVFISHEHYDHVSGLMSFLERNNDVTVYILPSYSEDLKKKIAMSGAKMEEIKEAREIYSGVYTTGELNNGVKEQSLIIKTTRGLVVVTGCAHPGIVNITKRSKVIGSDYVYLVLGGFHMKGLSLPVIENTINELKELGVKVVFPSHCTGALALQCFQDLFGENYEKSGAGKVIILKLNV